jgi:hypothetical protein
MSSDVITLLVGGGYLVVSLLATFFVRKRGFTGMRLVLLVMLVWLVPFLGAGCASAAAWERGRSVGGSDPIPNEWLAANSSHVHGGNDNGSAQPFGEGGAV